MNMIANTYYYIYKRSRFRALPMAKIKKEKNGEIFSVDNSILKW
jgi:hypothetical protein